MRDPPLCCWPCPEEGPSGDVWGCTHTRVAVHARPGQAHPGLLAVGQGHRDSSALGHCSSPKGWHSPTAQPPPAWCQNKAGITHGHPGHPQPPASPAVWASDWKPEHVPAMNDADSLFFFSFSPLCLNEFSKYKLKTRGKRASKNPSRFNFR